jgi:hypothetical protein
MKTFYTKCCYADCHNLIVILSVVTLSFVIPSVVIPSVVMPSVVMPSVVMPSVVILSVDMLSVVIRSAIYECHYGEYCICYCFCQCPLCHWDECHNAECRGTANPHSCSILKSFELKATHTLNQTQSCKNCKITDKTVKQKQL